jgi:thioesterase domain-containing protein
LFHASTVDALAQAVRGPISTHAWDSLVAIQTGGSKPPLYCVHHADGVVVCYRDLARYLGADQPVWGIQAQGLDGTQAPETKVEEIAARYVRDVLASNPDGPYLLCGLSFGGIVAFEMARQITAMGRRVDFIGLIDTYAPSYFRGDEASQRERPILFRAVDQITAMRRLEPKNRMAFVENKFKSGLRRLRQANGRQVVPEDVKEYLPEVLKAIKRASELATIEYFPKPYDGDVILFRALDRLDWNYKDRLMGWGGLANNIIVRDVVGNHYTVIQEPCVQVLAQEMRRALDESLVPR